MKKWIIIFMLCFSATANAQPWVERQPNDKIMHSLWGIGTQASLSALSTYAGLPHGPEVGLAGATITGIVKELVDKNFDPYDFAATAGGGVTSYLIDRFVIRPAFRIDVEPKKGGAILKLSSTF